MQKIDELDKIKELVNCIVEKIHPLKVYLFGSFAEGKNTANSDYDFYVVISDDVNTNTNTLMVEAQKSMRHRKNRSVDVIVNTVKTFDDRKDKMFTLEREVFGKGVLIYANE